MASEATYALVWFAAWSSLRRSAAKAVIDLHIQNGHLQQQIREMQVCWQVLRHVVSFKHQGEQTRPGEQATPQELARPQPPEQYVMPLSNKEQFCAAEAQLKNFTNKTLPLVFLGDSKTLQKVVREMVGRPFSKQVQERFSLLGYRGKSRFKDTIMHKAVIASTMLRLRLRGSRMQGDPNVKNLIEGLYQLLLNVLPKPRLTATGAKIQHD
ncbi:hypothetical protein HPB47_002342 [Ixodes persulcatus]|uniref:Uncharacterized protein n=1 Tax=Ixodes persulcatus TaxID=34615 RepID=A0AC60PN45_IXOPE|nr:hypothetical protein HPB47_002342 [Ixodes persulcatus]